MRQELELIRSTLYGAFESKIAARRQLREQSDLILRGSLPGNNRAALAGQLGVLMLIVAKAVDQYHEEPQLVDFVEATQALIETGRAVMDKGLTLDSSETTLCGAVMLEIVARGVCACIDLPYFELLQLVHAGHDIGAIAAAPEQTELPLEPTGLLTPLPQFPGESDDVVESDNRVTDVQRKCGMCGYVGVETDHIGQCPSCAWDELQPLEAANDSNPAT